MIKLFNKLLGSQWRKWDLHIHSVHSKESRAKLTVKDIFDSAIQNEISVIAVTDHSNVKALDEIWTQHESTFEIEGVEHKYSDCIEFIPGVELKSDKGQKPIHMIVLFPKEIDMGSHIERVTTNFLETNFLSKIGCTDSNVRAAGSGDYARGLLEIYVDFEETCKLVRSLGGVVIVHNANKHGGFDEGLSHTSRNPSDEEIAQSFNALKIDLMTKYVDICELPNGHKANLKSRDFYLQTFGKPCIISSDSHETYTGDKFSWIKADPSIEGLKQVLFEPSNRVYLGETSPFDPVHKIESVVIDFPTNTKIAEEEFCILPKTEIVFSPNLTCLIGGRGTGKSTILNLIHEKLKPGKNSFFKKHKLNLPKEKSVKDFVQIDADDEEKQIEFFSQNEIEEFALDLEKFTETIYPRLLKLGKTENLTAASDDLEIHLLELDKHINHIDTMHTLSVRAADNEKQKKTQENIISSLNDETYLDISNRLDQADKEIRRINSSKEKFEGLVQSLKTIITENEISQIDNEYDQQRDNLIKAIKHAVDRSTMETSFSSVLSHLSATTDKHAEIKQELSDFLESKGLKDSNLEDVASATEEVNRIDGVLADVYAQLENTKKMIEEFTHKEDLQQKYVDEIMKKLDEQNQSLTDLNAHVKPITLKYEFNTEKAKQHLVGMMMKEFSNLDAFINIRQSDIERHLFCIEPETISDHDKYLAAIQQASSTKTKTSAALVEYFSSKNRFETFKLKIKRVFSDVNAFKLIRVYYDGKQLENTSFGQRCTAAIILLIKLGNTPIIIDEPEAHLDSMLVANYLVHLIKESKQQRQIIFATHNANFAINGDAELINVLQVSSNNKTSIVPTTIENLAHREKLLQLEGGKKAFEDREKKYQIK